MLWKEKLAGSTKKKLHLGGGGGERGCMAGWEGQFARRCFGGGGELGTKRQIENSAYISFGVNNRGLTHRRAVAGAGGIFKGKQPTPCARKIRKMLSL